MVLSFLEKLILANPENSFSIAKIQAEVIFQVCNCSMEYYHVLGNQYLIQTNNDISPEENWLESGRKIESDSENYERPSEYEIYRIEKNNLNKATMHISGKWAVKQKNLQKKLV